MKTPDIEIYVKDANMELIEDWLNKHFSMVQLPKHSNEIFKKGKVIRALVGNNSVNSDLVITPRADEKTFCSIWLKKNISEWENDESCAQSLLKLADIEIRCSASGWSEEEEVESEQWLLLTREERKLINWG